MSSNLTLRLPLGACLLAVANAAIAASYVDVTTEVKLTGLTITVIDLKPLDGIESNFWFVDAPLRRSSRVGVGSFSLPDSYTTTDSSKNFGPAAAAATINSPSVTGTAHAEISGPGNLQMPTSMSSGQSLSFSSLPVRYGTNFNATAYINTTDTRDWLNTHNSFAVTPNTRIVVSATFESQTAFDVNNNPLRWDSQRVTAGSFSGISMQGELWDSSGHVVGYRSAYDSARHRLDQQASCVDGPRSMSVCQDVSLVTSDVMSASFETGAGQRFRGSLSVSSVSSIITTIPEPGTWPLLLAGIGALAALRYGRGRRPRDGSPV